MWYRVNLRSEQNGVPKYLAYNPDFISLLIKILFVCVFIPIERAYPEPAWETVQ